MFTNFPYAFKKNHPIVCIAKSELSAIVKSYFRLNILNVPQVTWLRQFSVYTCLMHIYKSYNLRIFPINKPLCSEHIFAQLFTMFIPVARAECMSSVLHTYMLHTFGWAEPGTSSSYYLAWYFLFVCALNSEALAKSVMSRASFNLN